MERCMCGDPWCPSCGTAQGTYLGRAEPNPDDLYEKERQRATDDGMPWPPAAKPGAEENEDGGGCAEGSRPEASATEETQDLDHPTQG